tara:strand:- start:472 stop:984 length:513 start_codon:yes stop_codon:yes gene_type:complete
MNNLFKFFLIIFFVFFSILNASAQNNVAYIDLDLLIKETNFGKKIYEELDKKKKFELQKINKKENELKNQEEEIKNKKNILTNIELDNEINALKKNINEFKTFKNEIQKNFEQTKNKKIAEFFEKVNPFIQDYLNKNSIDILLNNKYVIIGKNDLDITSKIINLINKNIN